MCSLQPDGMLGGMAVSWSEEDDSVIGGDLTAALAYVTPAGCAVVTAVAPIGLRDRDGGTVTFTTSLGFGRKLDRIRRNPRVALAYHAREHGFATEPRFVVVQGNASFDASPDRVVLEQLVQPAATRFLGAPKRGRIFWDRWLREYYADRVLVTVSVERVASWDNLACCGPPAVAGEPLPSEPPAAQAEPASGTAARVRVETAAGRIGRQAHVLAGYVGADERPFVLPVTVGPAGGGALPIVSAGDGLLPPGGRRAGLLAHSFRPQLVGLESRVYTGWLEVSGSAGAGRYYPFTESGFRAPANKTLLLLANGYLAKRGVANAAKARRESSTG